MSGNGADRYVPVSNDVALRYPCPKCRALSFVPCTYVSTHGALLDRVGTPFPGVHRERRELARASIAGVNVTLNWNDHRVCARAAQLITARSETIYVVVRQMCEVLSALFPLDVDDATTRKVGDEDG